MRLSAARVAFGTSVASVYAFILSPVVFVVWIAFFSNEIIAFPPEGYTTRWFYNALETRAFARGFVLSFQVALFAMIFGVTLGALASIALVRTRFPGREAVSTALLSPLVVPGIVAGTAIYIFYILVDDAFELRLAATLPGLVLAHVMLTIPWSVRLISASLVGIDRTVEEAAMNLGAARWTVFRRVTFPMMRAGIVAACLFSFIVSFENLELSLLLVGPGRTTLPIAILQYLEFNIDPTICAVAALQILLIGVAMVVTDRFVSLSRVV